MAQSLSNLAVGAKIKFGRHSINGEAPQDIIWRVVAKGHVSAPAYPSNSITLLADKVIDLKYYDAMEPAGEDSYRRTGGNNRYSVSNIDQWLNSDGGAGQWYVARHGTDAAPTTALIGANDAYADRPGFLHWFSQDEKNAILTTTIRNKLNELDGRGTEDTNRKVYLPAYCEVMLSYDSVPEGECWEYFANEYGNERLKATVTAQVFEHSTASTKPASISDAVNWVTRTCHTSRDWSHYIYGIGGTYGINGTAALYTTRSAAAYGIRPALNLSATTSISDTVDGDDCYTTIFNHAPSYPVNINIPTIYGGKTNTISWSSVIDPDGDEVSYELACTYNGSLEEIIYSGTNLYYSHYVPYGKSAIQYMVRAVDSNGAYSDYTRSAVVNIVNNSAPVISGTDSDLGIKTEGFIVPYEVTDSDGDGVTVVEAIDGVTTVSYPVIDTIYYSFAVMETTWLKLNNGTHTLTITATDTNGDSSVRTYTFTKNVTTCSVTTVPMRSTSMPTRISLSVSKNIPAEAIFKVEVCNNASGGATWEDATNAVLGNMVHNFTNTSTTNGVWSVSVRVTVDRNGGSGACYIRSIGGNFE